MSNEYLTWSVVMCIGVPCWTAYTAPSAPAICTGG